jgi:hypothetical protein
MAGRQAWGYISAIAGTGEVRRSAKRATVPSGRHDCDGNERYGLTAQNQAWNRGKSIDQHLLVFQLHKCPFGVSLVFHLKSASTDSHISCSFELASVLVV